MIYLLLTLMLLCTFFSKNFNILKFFIFSILLILAFFGIRVMNIQVMELLNPLSIL